MKSAMAQEQPHQVARVVVVDDDELLLRALTRLLSHPGHEVLPCTDATSALALVGAGGIDVVVSDIMMPAVDGYRVLSEVRMRPETSTIPFIFVSALADLREVRHRTGNLSADDYIVKPFARQELLEAVRIQADRSGDNLLPCGQGGGRTVAWRECRAAL